jgi:ribonuclease BN (tRNA processing enzyme)
MRLTVLGSAASYAGQGQACAGYLIEGGGARVLFDCGNGVLAKLARVLDPLTVDAVFITHGHPDHFVDLYALQSLLRYAPEGPAPSLPLWVPNGLFERMQALLSDRGRTELYEAFRCSELTAGESVRIRDLTVTPCPVEHTPPTFALVAEADGVRLCYTADTAPTADVLAAARGADLLLAEATLPEAYAGRAPHLTAGQAGALARDADVSALVLTHVWPSNDRSAMVVQAAAEFDGPVSVASEYAMYEVRPARHRKGS